MRKMKGWSTINSIGSGGLADTGTITTPVAALASVPSSFT